MGLDHAVGVEHTRSFRKVAHPQCIAMVASPAATDLLLSSAQLATRGSGLAQIPVHRRFGDRATELPLQEFVDHVRRSSRLLLLQFDRALEHGLAFLPHPAAVGAWPPAQSGNLLLAESAHLAPQRRQRDPLAAAIGQRDFLLAQVLEKPGALSWLNFLQQDRGQQRTPKDGPIIIGIIHFFLLQRNGWVLLWSAKLRQEKPDRVANWGNSGRPKHLSHSDMISSSCRAVWSVSIRSSLRAWKGSRLPPTR